MRLASLAMTLFAATMLAVAPVSAQGKNKQNGGDQGEMAGIPPSAAVGQALSVVPDAKPLGVRRSGGFYIVKLKRGNEVIQLRVDAQTGEVSQ